MLTTAANPDAWLLAALLVTTIAAWRSGRPAHAAWLNVVRIAARPPVLALLVVVTAGGLAARLGLGYLAPGAYAEDVLAARALLADERMYHGRARDDFAAWLRAEPAVTRPWELPGLSSCQAKSLEQRPQFYTAQGHAPTLLLASVPIVDLAGGRGLYVVAVTLSLVLFWLAAWLTCRTRWPHWPPAWTLLALVAVTAWQPLLAAVRQADSVLLAAALVVLGAWALRHAHGTLAALFVGTAVLIAPPALVFLAYLWRRSRRTAIVAAGVVATGAAGTVALAGPMIGPDYVSALADAARQYAPLATNYAWLSRALAAGHGAALLTALLLVAIVTLTVGADRSPAVSDDLALGLYAAAAVLAAPVAWSQHLVFALIVLPPLLEHALARAGVGGLAGWTLLAAALALTDPVVTWIHAAAQLAGWPPAWPGLPAWALATAWLWLLVSAMRSRHVPAASASPA